MPDPIHARHLKKIRALYETAEGATRHLGRTWYLGEHKDAARLSRGTGHPLHIVCACLAVLSPRCQWPRAKRACWELLSGGTPVGIFDHNIEKARAVLKTGRTDLICP